MDLYYIAGRIVAYSPVLTDPCPVTLEVAQLKVQSPIRDTIYSFISVWEMLVLSHGASIHDSWQMFYGFVFQIKLLLNFYTCNFELILQQVRSMELIHFNFAQETGECCPHTVVIWLLEKHSQECTSNLRSKVIYQHFLCSAVHDSDIGCSCFTAV